jgi:hypothetical protein
MAKGMALEKGEWAGWCFVLFTPVERPPGNPRIGGWEGGNAKESFTYCESNNGLPTSNQ